MGQQINARVGFTTKRVLTLIASVVFLVGLMFGIGMLASYCERNVHSRGEIATAVAPLSQESQRILPRAEDCDHEGDTGFIAAESPRGVAVETLVNAEVRVETVPVSTLYSVISQEETTTLTSTSTSLISVTLTPTTEDVCSMSVVTETATAYITVTFAPESTPSSSYEDDATVTGDASTVTEVDSSVSYSSGLPDATVSGGASTVTDVQTDVSYTSGLPDATVSGNPGTITNVETDISVTAGYPDVTISGDASTVTDTQQSYSLTTSTISQTGNSKVTLIISDIWSSYIRTTVTTVQTTRRTATTTLESIPITVTVSDLWPIPSSTSEEFFTSNALGQPGSVSSSTRQTRTFTVTETEIGTEPTIITATVSLTEPLFPPYPTNGTANIPSGTITNPVGAPTSTPVIISGGSKKPEPRGSWGSNGSSNLGCTVMIIAAIMFML